MKWQPYLKYKQLGVEWLGEVPEQWSIRRIKTALSRHDGGAGRRLRLRRDDRVAVD